MRCRLREEDGFTLVEVMVASVVLLVGVLGVLTMLVGSLRATSSVNDRVGANNLARELVEATREVDYDDLTTALVKARLQARELGSGSPWTIERRGVDYTVTAAACAYDSPTDRLATVAPADVCTPQPTGATGDPNGDDFRRATFRVAWREPAGERSATQTTLVVNPTGGLGPRVLGIAPVAQTITSAATVANITWTTTPATALRWAVDDGGAAGSVTGSTSFTTTWNLGSSGSGAEVLDGSYQITGQPFDDLNIAGEAKRANVVLNRRRPYAPPTLAGGHNTRLANWVELEWGLNRERDVLGYRVYWAGTDGNTGTADDELVCPAPGGGGMLDTATRDCVDLDPPYGATKYHIVAVDRDASNALREGDPRSLSVSSPSSRPHAPIGLAVATVGGLPTLVWLPPLLSNPSFYRIYRDGERYDRTYPGSLTYTDSSPGTGGHQYWITAVDSTFNESNIIGPVVYAG